MAEEEAGGEVEEEVVPGEFVVGGVVADAVAGAAGEGGRGCGGLEAVAVGWGEDGVELLAEGGGWGEGGWREGEVEGAGGFAAGGADELPAAEEGLA